MSNKKYNYTDKNISERLKHYRVIKRLNVIEFSKLLGISQGALSGLENKKSKPSSDTLANFYKNTDINIVWLLTGEGEMIRKPEKEGYVAKDAPIYNKKEKLAEDESDHALKDKLIKTQDKVISQLELIGQLKDSLAETEEKLKASEELAARIREEDEEAQRDELLKKRAV